MTRLLPHIARIRRRLRPRSIRAKLIVGFGVLLLLGAFNIGVFYWGAYQRNRVFHALRQAIERQVVVADVMDQLEDQKRLVDLMAGVIGVSELPSPDAEEQAHFARGIDTIAVRLGALLAQTDAERRPALESLYEKTRRLAASWKSFYAYQWTSPSRAIEELYVRAEPLAEELLAEELPEAVAREKAQLAATSALFVQTDRTFGRLAWISFLLSATIGVGLAFFVSRDLVRAIGALKAGAERVGAGDLRHRIEVRSRDELGEVAASFNAMAERLAQRTAELAARRDEVEAQRDDLTRALEHLRATQAQLIQQEKMASLGALTAGIAHEIKNPLNFVNNFAGLSRELAEELQQAADAGDLDEARTLIDTLKLNAQKIEEHGRRADGIVRSMLAHSRGSQGERRPVDVNALVEEYLNLAYHGMRAQRADFNVTLRRAYDASAGRVEMAPQEIGRVLLNLMNNAFYAVDERRREAGQDYVPAVTLHTRRTAGAVQIEVEDNGPGIPPALRSRIFEPFFTTKPAGSGTGLGLSLSYDIVTQGHDGTMTVESEPGAFTRFTIALPTPEPAATTP